MKNRINTRFTTFVALIATLICALAVAVTLLAMPTHSVITASAEEIPEENTYHASSANFEEQWNDAVVKSIGSDPETFTLTGNWEAVNHIFGDGNLDGFTADGGLCVPEGANIILNLNGFTIDRGNGGGSVITVYGTLTLKDSKADATTVIGTGKITGGNSYYGGGVYVDGLTFIDGGTFIMESGKISGNTAERDGGGVYVRYGEFKMNGGLIGDSDSSEDGNTAQLGGGVFVNYSEFTLSGNATISYNVATGTFGGGGVYLDYYNKITMSDNATISYNTAIGYGGGVLIGGEENEFFKMNDNATISYNTAESDGGGVHVSTGCPITMNDNATISYNTAERNGGGVYRGSLTMNDNATISYNTAKGNGGGVYILAGNFNINGNPKIYGNTLPDKTTLNNIELSTDAKITVAGELTEGAEIWVHGEVDANQVGFTSGYGTNNEGIEPFKYFKADCGKVVLLNGSGEAYISNITSLQKPTYTVQEFTYDGTEKEIVVKGLNDNIVVGGELKATNAATYNVTISIADKTLYAWADGTQDDITFSWTIKAKPVEEPDLPEVNVSEGGGTIQIPDDMQVVGDLPEGWEYDEDTGVITIPDGAENGDHKIQLKPKDNQTWPDGSTGSKDFTVTISGGDNPGGDNPGGNFGGLPEGGAVNETAVPWIVVALVPLVIGGLVTFICVMIDRKYKDKKEKKDKKRKKK